VPSFLGNGSPKKPHVKKVEKKNRPAVGAWHHPKAGKKNNNNRTTHGLFSDYSSPSPLPSGSSTFFPWGGRLATLSNSHHRQGHPDAFHSWTYSFPEAPPASPPL
jgi:hypothetical protein